MNRSLFRIVPQALVLVAAIVLSGVPMAAQDSAPAGQRTDGQIEMDVVHALDASQSLKSDLITAATIQGEVTLSGTVSSDASKSLAESIVKGVPGVSGVHNNLKVGNPADDPNAQGAVDDSASQDNGDYSQQQAPANPPTMAPSPDQNQNQAPGYGQQTAASRLWPEPATGRAAGVRTKPAASWIRAESTSWLRANAPPPGYGQNPPPGYGRISPRTPLRGTDRTLRLRDTGRIRIRPQYRQQYPSGPPQPSYAVPNGPVTVSSGTLLQLRTSEAVSSKRAKEGEPVQFTVIRDVAVGNYLAIPRGATVHGVISEVHHSGELAGSPELALRLTMLDLGGHDYPLQSDLFKVKGPSKTGHTVGNAIGGALLGAIIGGAAGGGGGAAIGAAAGGTVGTAASAATPGPNAWIPAEALVTFHLTAPITVDPVSREEAARLAEGLYQGGPNLYQRGPYGRPYYAGPYPYGYPPVYYRPYYVVGGSYYWR